MRKIIAFSGPQGSGKTTLLNKVYDKLKNSGANVYLDDFKVSRAVQKKLGWNSLDNVLNAYDTMNDYQHQVSLEKFNVIQHYPNVDIILTERCHADIISYYELWKTKFENVSAENHEWLSIAKKFQSEVYSNIIYVPFMEHVKFEYDPNRGFKDDIQFYDELLRSNLSILSSNNTFNVTKASVEDRAEEVCDYLRKL